MARHIDWTPFFRSWELAGTYPQILVDEAVGEAARNLFRDAQEMLAKIVKEKWIRPRAVIGFWPAAQVGEDDIALYTDETRTSKLADARSSDSSRNLGDGGSR